MDYLKGMDFKVKDDKGQDVSFGAYVPESLSDTPKAPSIYGIELSEDELDMAYSLGLGEYIDED